MHVSPEQQLSEVQDSLIEAHVLAMHVEFSHLPSKQQSAVVLHVLLSSTHFSMPQIPVWLQYKPTQHSAV
jgi:hypothetical protein